MALVVISGTATAVAEPTPYRRSLHIQWMSAEEGPEKGKILGIFWV